MSIRKPTLVETLYLDFDGFFASVEQQARPALRGKPVGVVPFDTTEHTCVIACSKEAKARGVKNVMPIKEAKKCCYDLVLVPQSPDLYRRAHHTLLNEISSVVPIDAIKSIDEITCKLDKRRQQNPLEVARQIKTRLHDNVGAHITCSIGIAANRLLAKLACKIDKPNGVTVWHPQEMPAPLLQVPLEDITGVGDRMRQRLFKAGIYSTESLLNTSPKQLRALWRNVTGERLWYGLHGYDIKAQPSKRGMFGHSRVLPPECRNKKEAKACARLLLVKAARRMRREGFYAGKLWLHFSIKLNPKKTTGYSSEITFPPCQDDHGCMSAFDDVWAFLVTRIPAHGRILRVGVTLLDLTEVTARQLDLFADDDKQRQKWEQATKAIDSLNSKYGRTIISIGTWKPPAGGYAGGKISYTRIPSAEDFM